MMGSRLVIPAGALPDDLSWIEREDKPLTWAEVAAENSTEVADDAWLKANGVDPADGVGIREETPPVPEPPIAIDTPEPSASALEVKVDALTEQVAALVAALKKG